MHGPRMSNSGRCFFKYYLRTKEKVVGPKRCLATHRRPLWLLWIVALLHLPFVYDVQGSSLPRRLPSNPRPRPPVS